MMGYELRAIPHIMEQTSNPETQEHIAQIQRAREEAQYAMEAAQKVIERRVKAKTLPFQKGQMVWLDGSNLRIPNVNRKLKAKREGSFEISKVMGHGVYKLDLSKKWRIHATFHATLSSPYHETEEHRPNYPRPPPDILEQGESYKVEAIVGH